MPLWGTHMHTPSGCALMGWVPYPAHMGPRFAGPIVGALWAPLKKKKDMCSWGHPEAGGNNGQKLCKPGVNLRLTCARHLPKQEIINIGNALAFSGPIAVYTSVFLIYPLGQSSWFFAPSFGLLLSSDSYYSFKVFIIGH